MTNLLNTAITNPITEDDIANYLCNTPDFFERHANVLASIELTSPYSHRAISLQERQAEMLREKIKLLEQRIMEMIRHGNDNVMLADRILRWATSLLPSAQPQTLPAQVVQAVQSEFAVPQVGLRLWDLAASHSSAHSATDSATNSTDSVVDAANSQALHPFTDGVSEDAKLFAASLTEPFCGLNTGFEVVAWLPEPSAVTSLALIPLRVNVATPDDSSPTTFGLLVLASGDAQRFTNGMGTEFLNRIGDVASAALGRLR